MSGKTKMLSFADLARGKQKEKPVFFTNLMPHEAGLDSEALGLEKEDTLRYYYGLLTREELTECIEVATAAAGDSDSPEYQREREIAILTRASRKPKTIETEKAICLPQITDSPEGRRFLQSWAPGTQSTVASLVQQTAGFRSYRYESPKETLKNSPSPTAISPSN